MEDTNDDLKHVSPSPGDPAHEAHHAKTDEIRALLQDNPDLKDCIYSNLEERDYVVCACLHTSVVLRQILLVSGLVLTKMTNIV